MFSKYGCNSISPHTFLELCYSLIKRWSLNNFSLLECGQACDSLCNQPHMTEVMLSDFWGFLKEAEPFPHVVWTRLLKLLTATWAEWVSWIAILCARSKNDPTKKDTGQHPATPAPCYSTSVGDLEPEVPSQSVLSNSLLTKTRWNNIAIIVMLSCYVLEWLCNNSD